MYETKIRPFLPIIVCIPSVSAPISWQTFFFKVTTWHFNGTTSIVKTVPCYELKESTCLVRVSNNYIYTYMCRCVLHVWQRLAMFLLHQAKRVSHSCFVSRRGTFEPKTLPTDGTLLDRFTFQFWLDDLFFFFTTNMICFFSTDRCFIGLPNFTFYLEVRVLVGCMELLESVPSGIGWVWIFIFRFLLDFGVRV